MAQRLGYLTPNFHWVWFMVSRFREFESRVGSVLTAQNLLDILPLSLPLCHSHSVSLKINKQTKKKKKKEFVLSIYAEGSLMLHIVCFSEIKVCCFFQILKQV